MGVMNMSNVKKKVKMNFIMIIFFVALIYITYLLVQQQTVLNSYVEETEYYKSKIEYEEAINEKLREMKELYSSDVYIEEVARDKLGLVKPGEKIFVDISE